MGRRGLYDSHFYHNSWNYSNLDHEALKAKHAERKDTGIKTGTDLGIDNLSKFCRFARKVCFKLT